MAFDLNSIGALISGGGLSAVSRRTKVGKEDAAKVLSQGLAGGAWVPAAARARARRSGAAGAGRGRS